MADEEFFGNLGEQWWRETGATCSASEAQIRFAAARHQGATKSRAAAMAGYSGNREALRSAGTRASGSKAVQNMLALAAAAAVGVEDNPVTLAEARGRVGKLVRSPDPQIALKASELFTKLVTAENERTNAGADSHYKTYEDWAEDTRNVLARPGNGVGLVAMMYLGAIKDIGPRLVLGGLPLFERTVPHIASEFPELVQRMRSLLDADCQRDLDRMVASPAVPIERLVGKLAEISSPAELSDAAEPSEALSASG